MNIETIFDNLEKDGWDLRIGGYMKNKYVLTPTTSNGIGVFIEKPEGDSFCITCKKWESISIELYDGKRLHFSELPKNYVEYIDRIACTMYKQGLIKYNLEKLAKDFE